MALFLSPAIEKQTTLHKHLFAARNIKDDNFLFSRNTPEQVKVFTGDTIQVVNQPGIA